MPTLEVLEGRLAPAVLTVNTLADESTPDKFLSLREAINVVDAGSTNGLSQAEKAQISGTLGHHDTIQFAPKLAGTITLSAGELDITKSLAIQGPAGPPNRGLTISGNNASRIFSISGGPTVTISDLTLANGQVSDGVIVEAGNPVTAGAGILVRGGTLSVDHTAFTGNVAEGGFSGSSPLVSTGAAIGVFGASSSLNVDQCTFSDNDATGSIPIGGGQTIGSLSAGGAIGLENTTAKIDHSTFTGNVAVGMFYSTGGAIDSAFASVLTIDHSTFTDNIAETFLGATNTGPLAVVQGMALGGAIIAGEGTHTTMDHTVFQGNQALGGNGAGVAGGDGSGGAIDVESQDVHGAALATLAISHSTFTQNLARGGDGTVGTPGGPGAGGVIAATSAQVSVSHSDFTNNLAMGGNGGSGSNGGDAAGGVLDLAIDPSAVFPNVFTVDHSTFSGNQAVGGQGGDGGDGGSALGGAYYFFTGTINIDHSTLSGNEAIGGQGGTGGNGGLAQGGASFNDAGNNQYPPVDMTLAHSSITGNKAIGGLKGTGGTSDGQADGGGIYNLGDLTTTDSDISGNSPDNVV